MCAARSTNPLNPGQRALLGGLAAYKRLISPLLGQRCRFYPSCSAYAAEAVARHGSVRGAILTGFRVLRCQPLCEGGLDPVPLHFPARPWQRNSSADPAADAPP
jgi:hypothetical protein